MFGRSLQEYGQSFVGTSLILGGNIQHHVVIAISPVLWQTFIKPLWTLGEQTEEDVWPLTDDVPRLVAPQVGFLDEEIGGKTYVLQDNVKFLMGLQFLHLLFVIIGVQASKARSPIYFSIFIILLLV